MNRRQGSVNPSAARGQNSAVVTPSGPPGRQGITISVVNDEFRNRFHHHSRHSRKLVWFVGSIVAFFLILRWQGDKLRHDWTPIGIAVKAMLVMTLFAMMSYPYEVFVKGPDATTRALRS